VVVTAPSAEGTLPHGSGATLHPTRAALFVVGAALLFGTTGTAQALGPAGTTPLSVGAVRLLVGGSLLAAIGLARRVRRAGWTLPRPSSAALWVVAGAASVMAYQATFFAGTRANGVAVGTVVALGSSPLSAGLFEWLLWRHRPSVRWLAATGLAVAGMAALAGLLGSSAGRVDPAGLLASLGAGASYAAYTVASRALLQRGWGATSAVSAMLGTGAVLAAVVLAGTDTGWLAAPGGLALAAGVGVVTVVVTYLLLGQGLRGLRAATATTLTLAEPATAATLGVLLLGEVLAPLQWTGLAAVVIGVVVAGTEAPPRPTVD
jgi:DME family drug/metabolite transporter